MWLCCSVFIDYWLFGRRILSHTWTCKRIVSVPLCTLGISFTVKEVIKDNVAFATQHFSVAVQHCPWFQRTASLSCSLSLICSIVWRLCFQKKKSYKIKSLVPATLRTTLCTFFLLDFLLKGHASNDFLHGIKLKLWQVSGFIRVTGSKHGYITFDFRSRCLSEETLNKTVKAVAPKE